MGCLLWGFGRKMNVRTAPYCIMNKSNYGSIADSQMWKCLNFVDLFALLLLYAACWILSRYGVDELSLSTCVHVEISKRSRKVSYPIPKWLMRLKGIEKQLTFVQLLWVIRATWLIRILWNCLQYLVKSSKACYIFGWHFSHSFSGLSFRTVDVWQMCLYWSDQAV